MRRTHWLFTALAVLASLALLACSSDEPGDRSESPSSTPTASPTETPPSTGPGRGGATGNVGAPARPPEGAIAIDGEPYPLGLGSYCWGGTPGGSPSLCVDAAGTITARPHASAEPGAAITLAGTLAEPGFEVQLVQFGPAPAAPVASDVGWEAWRAQFDETHALPVESGMITLPGALEPGAYLLELYIARADVPGNTATYGAAIEIQ